MCIILSYFIILGSLKSTSFHCKVSLYEKEFSEDINLIIYDEDNLLVNINDIKFTDKEEYSKAISQLLIDMEKECFSLCADFCKSEAFKKEYVSKDY